MRIGRERPCRAPFSPQPGLARTVHAVAPHISVGARRRAEDLLGLVLVVLGAAKLDPIDIGLAPNRERDDVMKLEQPGLPAPALRTDERATPTISFPHGAPDCRRNVSGTRSGRLRTMRALRRGKLRPFEPGDEGRQRAVEDCRGITVRDDMPQQILRAPELVVGLAADGHGDLESLRRERCDDRRTNRRHGRREAAGCLRRVTRRRNWLRLARFLGREFPDDVGTSGRGRRAAACSSTARLLCPRAASSTARWFSTVRCGASKPTVVRLSNPSTSRSRITGNRAAARAA